MVLISIELANVLRVSTSLHCAAYVAMAIGLVTNGVD